MLRRGACALVPTGLSAGCAKTAGDSPGTPTPAKRQTSVQDRLPDLPVADRWDVVGRAVEAAARTEVSDAAGFEAAVEDGGPKVTSLKTTPSLVELTGAPAPTEGGVARTVGLVAGAYAAFVRSGATVTRLNGTLETSGGEPFGSFQVTTDWAERYLRGAWSAEAYGEAVLGTLKTKR